MWLALSLVIVVVLIEAVLRWVFGFGDPPLARVDTDTEYELVAPAEYRRWGNEVSINSDGMRAAELPATPDVDDRRLLIIGDSVVYGGHRIDQSETIAAQLAAGLGDDSFLAGCRPVVVPMAVSSWGPANQAAFLKRDGHFAAQVAAIVVSAHDLYDIPTGRIESIPYRLGPMLEPCQAP